MAEVTVLAASGDQMVAEAFRQANPDVLPVYPITPQTIIVEEFDKFVADGKVHTEFVPVESEHSAMAAAIGASSAGARTVTATASQGLAYMWEELYIAAGMRLPIVMANANRALSAPINIHGDHSDVMGCRDAGWILLFAENAQEAYDDTLIAFRVAEHPEVMLPVMTTLDGFITSHALERAELLDDATVAEFVGEYKPEHSLLDTENPVSYGMFANLGNFYMETKKGMRVAMEGSLPIIEEIGAEFEKISGRPFEAVKTYGMEDAERVIVVIGSCTGNVRHVAKQLREKGEKVGVVSLRVFRPFPFEKLVDALKGAKAIAVLDRSETIGGQGGPLWQETNAALKNAGVDVPTRNYIYGLGGADVTLDLINEIYADLNELPAQAAEGKIPAVTYKGNR
jgi:pyruvate ferredoxin oxidoreductase alpha subunit